MAAQNENKREREKAFLIHPALLISYSTVRQSTQTAFATNIRIIFNSIKVRVLCRYFAPHRLRVVHTYR